MQLVLPNDGFGVPLYLTRTTGTVDYDAADPTRSKLDVSVDATFVYVDVPDFERSIW